MAAISIRDLLEAGVHFGHQTKRWNPKMKPYIFGARNGIYIIDLQKTARLFDDAYKFLVRTVAQGGKVLFVGTKKQAQEIVRKEAERCGMYYVNSRWLGGTLTNFQTIKTSIDHLNELERAQVEGKSVVTKKEALQLEREVEKLNRSLGGIKDMRGLPAAIFVIDVRKEHIAVAEAARLKIPCIAVVDTNCDPEGINYVVPGNDDALKSIQLFTSAVANACLEGQHMKREYQAAPAVDGVMGGVVGNVEVVKGRRGTAEAQEADSGDEEVG